MATKTSEQDLQSLGFNIVKSKTAFEQMVAAGNIIQPNEFYFVEGPETADEAIKLQTSRELSVALNSVRTEENKTSFDGSADVINITVNGVLNPGQGGTGQASLVASANSLLNSLTTGSSVPSMNDYYISQYAGGGTTTTTYHRRPVSKLYDLFSSTMSNSGNAHTATSLATARELSVDLNNVRTDSNKTTFNGSNDVTNITIRNVLGIGNGGTNAASAQGAVKNLVGSAAIGSTSAPIYYKGDGTFAVLGTKGSATKPVYLATNGVVTEGSLYAGGTAVTLNGTGKGATTASFYAPTGGGTAGYVLIAGGNNTAPSWSNELQIASGKITANAPFTFSNPILANHTNDSSHSQDTNASIVTSGGLSVAKNASVKSLRIDNNQTSKGVSLQYNEITETLNFIFA